MNRHLSATTHPCRFMFSARFSDLLQLGAACLFAGCLSIWAADDAPTPATETPVSEWVLVVLDAKMNHKSGVVAQADPLVIDGVPFRIAATAQGDTLSLRDAGWPLWQSDSSSYYSVYDQNSARLGPKRRPVFPENAPAQHIVSAPVDDYLELCLLAYAEDDQALSDIMTVRIGSIGGRGLVDRRDFPVKVPRRGSDGATPVGPGGTYLLRVPLKLAANQDFASRDNLEVELTKELRLAVRRPDPSRYQIRPLGLPSGVHLLAMTLRRSPVTINVVGTEPGNVFNEPDSPSFQVTLGRRNWGDPGPYHLDLRASDHAGAVTTLRSAAIDVAADGVATVDLTIPVTARGHYGVTIQLKSGERTLLEKQTHIAILPPDTRRFRERAPFGVWDFCGAHVTPNDPVLLGPLHVKAGFRYGQVSKDPTVAAAYGILPFRDQKGSAAALEKLAVQVAAGEATAPARIMIFHETGISGSHVMRIPSAFSGRAYTFDAKEQARFEKLQTIANETSKVIRQHFPNAEIYFGNGNPLLIEEFLRREYPPEYIGTRGNEAPSFGHMPESQPPDWLTNGASLWMDRQLLDHYGYTETPIRQCYEMCYPCTNPGNLSLKTQADFYVRHVMHSLAWRIPVIRAGLIVDTANSYYYSNWGAAGLCFGLPDVSPKPSYVAAATMTWQLDGMAFSRIIDTGSPVVYALEFTPIAENPSKSVVTCMWTVRGSRPLSMTGSPGSVRLVDAMGREQTLASADGRLETILTPSPVYLRSAVPLSGLTLGKPSYEQLPSADVKAVDRLVLKDWRLEDSRDDELELYNFMTPRRKGDFAVTAVDEHAGETGLLRIEPRGAVPGSPYLPMYASLRRTSPVTVPGEPTALSVQVHGNAGWGRVIFEFVDAKGERWISIGAEQKGEPTRWMADWLTEREIAETDGSDMADWNTEDPRGLSRINFEGWRELRFPLPGNYPGPERYHWPASHLWRFSDDGIVDYPIAVTRLVVTAPEKVLQIDRYEPVAEPAIYLKNLSAHYGNPLDAHVALDYR